MLQKQDVHNLKAGFKLPYTRLEHREFCYLCVKRHFYKFREAFQAETPGLSLLWLPHTPTVHLAALFSIFKNFRQQQTTSKRKDKDRRWKTATRWKEQNEREALQTQYKVKGNTKVHVYKYMQLLGAWHIHADVHM